VTVCTYDVALAGLLKDARYRSVAATRKVEFLHTANMIEIHADVWKGFIAIGAGMIFKLTY
jgi:hypothetical protein